MNNPLTVAILIVSDRAMTGERPDATGPALQEFLQKQAAQIVEVKIAPDEKTQIAAALRKLCEKADLVLSAGGTGLAKRDVTPEATMEVIEKTVPGIAEAMRAAGLAKTPHAMLSRGVVGVRGRSLIVNLPGSPKGAVESLEAVWVALPHAAAVVAGPVADEAHRPER
jgi:molybdenum cofactor synthesis domain-containing protein